MRSVHQCPSIVPLRSPSQHVDIKSIAGSAKRTVSPVSLVLSSASICFNSVSILVNAITICVIAIFQGTLAIRSML